MNFKKKNKKDIPAQPSLTAEQLEILTSRVEQVGDDRSDIEPFDNSAKAKAIRYARSHKASTIILGIAAVSLILVLVALIVYAVYEISNNINKQDFEITIGDEVYEKKYDEMVINDLLYIDVRKIATLGEMTYSGDATTRKFTLPNTQYVKFEKNSEYAIVDGASVSLGGETYFNDEECLVPYRFISKIISSGMTFEIDTKENVISIQRVVIGENKDKVPVYEDITFSIDDFRSLSVGYGNFGVDFQTISSYIDPDNEDDILILVNHQNPLSEDYIPADLVQLTCDTNPVNSASYYRLRQTAAGALYAMMQAIENTGIVGLEVSSSYRSYDRQLERWNQDIDYYMNQGYTREQSEQLTNEFLARPGESEHQTGLCVDFVFGTTTLTEDFEDTEAFEWLCDNAHKFGFILRYPEDKVDITGYGYEPWHYRFVGRSAASRIYESSLCFEEYIELTTKE